MNKQLATALSQFGKASLIIGGTIAGLVLFYTFAVMPLQAANQRAKERNTLLEQKADLAKTKTLKKEEISEDLKNAIQRLALVESTFPDGDLYLWMLRKLQRFEDEMPIHISHVSPPRVEKIDDFPKVPYKSTVYGITGSAHYHDVGEFIEQLENTFPHFVVVNLELEPANLTGAETEPSEALVFKLEVAALSKATTY